MFKNFSAFFLILSLMCTICTQMLFAPPAYAEDTSTVKPSYDLDAYDFTDPSLMNPPVPGFLTDQQFFGVWDKETQTFITPPKLNYSYLSPWGFDLKGVLAAVKEGDYPKAKEELLTYYRNVTRARGLEPKTSSRTQKLTADLALQNFHFNSSGQNVADIFYVNSKDWGTVEVDLLSEVERFKGSELMPVYLIAVNKDDYEAEFYSKEAGTEHAPYIEAIVGGTAIKIPVKYDTYVAAGANRNNNYGREERLYAREVKGPWTYPVGTDTRRVYLMFDLSSIRPGDPVSSAKLKLYGRYVDKADPPRNNPSYRKMMVAMTNSSTSWTEDTAYYADPNTQHAAFSYDGEYGFEWIAPNPECNAVVRIDQEMLRFGTWWDLIVSEYNATKNEVYAKAAMMFLHDFIKETFYEYRGKPGKFAYPPDPGYCKANFDKGIYGGYSVSLDAHTRASVLPLFLPYLYDSPNMTPEILTTFVKYLWNMGDFEARYWGSSEKGGNWGTAACSGFYRIMAYYPEFVDIPNWMNIMWRNMNEACSSIVQNDGSSHELSLSYTSYALGTMTNLKGTAEGVGTEIEYSQDMKNKIIDITRYMMNVSGPGFSDIQYGDGSTYERNYIDRFKFIGEWLNDPLLLWAASDGKKGTKPNYTSYCYQGAGKMAVLRSGWGKNDLYLNINADNAEGTHAHWDDLGIIVMAYGEYLLADPLYYTYAGNDLSHRWLVSSRGHNTIEINDVCQKSNNPGSMDTVLPKGGSKGNFERVELNDSYDFIKLYTPNYKNITYRGNPKVSAPTPPIPPTEPGADVTRNVLFVKPNFWIVSDYMNPVDKQKSNKYSQIWHTQPDAKVSIDGQYVLKPGEKVGDVNGELDTVIENTQFVPGTGNGTIRTNNQGSANIMIVPADISTVTPSLRRGLYSYGQTSLMAAVYATFDKNAVGTTGFDTILFPTRPGEEYKVEPTPLALDLPQGAGSAFKAYIKDLSGKTSNEYNFNYYILHEKDKQKDLAFGDYSVDGTLAYYESKVSGYPRRLVIEDATHLKENVKNFEIFKSNVPVEELSIEWVGSELQLHSSKGVDLNELTIYAPIKVTNVTLNGARVDYKQKNNYVYFGSNPMLDGSNIPPYEKIDTPAPTDKPSGGKTHGGGNGGVSGPVTPLGPAEPVNPARPSDKFKSELSNHWGKDEIAYLVDKGIVKGSGETLALDKNISRSEFVAMILRALGIEPVPYKNSFGDVSASDWYAGYLQAALDNNILEGSDGNAYPEELLTREQAVKIMLKALEAKGTVVYSDKAPEFNDVGDISDWSRKFVSTAVSMGLIKGVGNNMFMPRDNTLREQAMVMVFRLLDAADKLSEKNGR